MGQGAAKTFVGIDIGATYTRLAIVDALGRVMADRHTETPQGNDGDDLIRWLDEAYAICRQETDSAPAPEAIGVGVPGVLEPGRSAVIKAINLPCLEGLPIRDRLVERTGLITVVDCDTVTAAWGEFCVRQRQPGRFAYLTIGTGIGGAVIIDRQIIRHTHHCAGHWGHLICDTTDQARPCPCGARGCLEAQVAGPTLNEAALAAGFGGGIGDVEPAYQEGDPAAVQLIETTARYLAVGLINLAHLYPVDILVVGGGVAIGLPSLVRRAAAVAGQAESVLVPERMAVELTALRDYAGPVGAALLAAEHITQRLRPE